MLGLKATLLASVGMLGVQIGEWVHGMAGTAGDVVVIGAAVGVAASMTRRMWRRTGGVVVTRIQTIEDNTAQVPAIADQLGEHVRDTRARFERGELRFEGIETQLRELRGERLPSDTP